MAAADLARQDELFTDVLARAHANVVTVDAASFDAFSDSDVAGLACRLLGAVGRAA